MSFGFVVMLLLSTFAAALVQSVTGFGFGIVCMMVFPYIIAEYSQAVALSTFCSAAMSIMAAAKVIKIVKIKTVLPALCSYLFFSIAAINFVSGKSTDVMMKALGAVLVAVSIYFIFLNNKIKVRPTTINGIIAGGAGGIGAGMFSIGGPPAVIYFLSASEKNEEYRANVLFYFALGNCWTTGYRIAKGIITTQVFSWWVICLAAIALGVVWGERIFKRLDPLTLRRVVYGFMALSGLKMLLQ